ncbi:MAG: SCO family protein [Ilumatobacteraceae bacterium]
MIRICSTLVVAAVVAVTGCGGSDAVPADAEFAGYRREPAPDVGLLSLPDVGADGAEFRFRAEPGEILAVYFGFTNCPDFCPTTLSDLRLATRRMEPTLAERVDLAMVTVDPERDLSVLDGYVTSFLDGAHALGTEDAGRLAEVAAPFGAGYSITTGDDGDIEVSHTTSLYAVDDRGRLVLTWQFGVSIDDLAADLTRLLSEEGA